MPLRKEEVGPSWSATRLSEGTLFALPGEMTVRGRPSLPFPFLGISLPPGC